MMKLLCQTVSRFPLQREIEAPGRTLTPLKARKALKDAFNVDEGYVWQVNKGIAYRIYAKSHRKIEINERLEN